MRLGGLVPLSRKRILVASILIMIIVAGVVAGYALYSQYRVSGERTYSVSTEEGLVEVAFENPFPVLPKEIANLKIVNRSMTADETQTAAKEIFNLEGTIERWQNAYMVQNEMPDTLYIYDLGGFHWQSYYPGPVVDPSSDEIKPAAEAFVENLKTHGLTPAHPSVEIDECVVSNVSTMGGTVQTVFDLKFVGLRVGQISVNVAYEGKIAAAYGRYREIMPEQNITLMSVEEELKSLPQKLIQALNQDLQRHNMNTSAYPRMKRIAVESVTLEYFSWDLSEPQDYLLPVFVFTFKIDWETPHLPYPSDHIYYCALSATNATYIYGSSLTGIS